MHLIIYGIQETMLSHVYTSHITIQVNLHVFQYHIILRDSYSIHTRGVISTTAIVHSASVTPAPLIEG